MKPITFAVQTLKMCLELELSQPVDNKCYRFKILVFDNA